MREEAKRLLDELRQRKEALRSAIIRTRYRDVPEEDLADRTKRLMATRSAWTQHNPRHAGNEIRPW